MFVPIKTKCRYTILEQELRKKIHSGKWKAGMMIPGEFELAAIYHLGGTTVRKALCRLADQNFLCKVNGFRTYVMPDSKRQAQARKLTRGRLIIPANRKEAESLELRFMPETIEAALSEAEEKITARLKHRKLLNI